MNKKIIDNPEEFINIVGETLGASEWKLVTQKEINNFASATEDFQWIHVNENKTQKDSPFKTTIAHGYYSLSLIPKFVYEIWECKNLKLILKKRDYTYVLIVIQLCFPINKNLNQDPDGPHFMIW